MLFEEGRSDIHEDWRMALAYDHTHSSAAASSIHHILQHALVPVLDVRHALDHMADSTRWLMPGTAAFMAARQRAAVSLQTTIRRWLLPRRRQACRLQAAARRMLRSERMMARRIRGAISHIHYSAVAQKGPITAESVKAHFSSLEDPAEALKDASRRARAYLARKSSLATHVAFSGVLDVLDAQLGEAVSEAVSEATGCTVTDDATEAHHAPLLADAVNELNDAAPKGLSEEQIHAVCKMFSDAQECARANARRERELIDEQYRKRLSAALGTTQTPLTANPVLNTARAHLVPSACRSMAPPRSRPGSPVDGQPRFKVSSRPGIQSPVHLRNVSACSSAGTQRLAIACALLGDTGSGTCLIGEADFKRLAAAGLARRVKRLESSVQQVAGIGAVNLVLYHAEFHLDFGGAIVHFEDVPVLAEHDGILLGNDFHSVTRTVYDFDECSDEDRCRHDGFIVLRDDQRRPVSEPVYFSHEPAGGRRAMTSLVDSAVPIAFNPEALHVPKWSEQLIRCRVPAAALGNHPILVLPLDDDRVHALPVMLSAGIYQPDAGGYVHLRVINPSQRPVRIAQLSALGRFIIDPAIKDADLEFTSEEIIKNVQLEPGCSHLQREDVLHMLQTRRRLFASKLGWAHGYQHSLNIPPDATPPNIPPRRLAPAEYAALKEAVDKQMKAGLLEYCSSPFNARPMMVPKLSGGWRCVLDYRQLNQLVLKAGSGCSYPLPRVEDNLNCLAKAKYFTAVDLLMGFHQVEMVDGLTGKLATAFSTPWGQMCYTRMPMGLTSSPGAFMMVVDAALRGLPPGIAVAYVDDILIPTDGDWNDHLRDVGLVFDRLIQAGFTVNPKKVFIGMREVPYLGYLVGAYGTKPNPERTKAIFDMSFEQIRTDPQAASRFAGMISFYSRFLKNLHITLAPFHELKSKHADVHSILNSLKLRASFEVLRNQLADVTALTRPDYSKDFHVHVDTASSVGMGASLMQLEDDNDPTSLRPIAFWSHRLTENEKGWPVRDQECYGLVRALREWRPYILGTHTRVKTDHKTLKWLMTTNHTPGTRVQHWVSDIQQYDLDIDFIPGSDNVVADCFSRAITNLLRVVMRDDSTGTSFSWVGGVGEETGSSADTTAVSCKVTGGVQPLPSERLVPDRVALMILNQPATEAFFVDNGTELSLPSCRYPPDTRMSYRDALQRAIREIFTGTSTEQVLNLAQAALMFRSRRAASEGVPKRTYFYAFRLSTDSLSLACQAGLTGAWLELDKDPLLHRLSEDDRAFCANVAAHQAGHLRPYAWWRAHNYQKLLTDNNAPLYFWKSDPSLGPQACLSNWYLANFKDPARSDIDHFFCAEQYMMLAKAELFGDTTAIAAIIAEQHSPQRCKSLGRHVRNFDEKLWSQRARDLLEPGIYLKFTQNPDLREYLLQTGDRLLVEAAPNDAIWGIGYSEHRAGRVPRSSWGKNWLGEVLMRVRTRLSEEESSDNTATVATAVASSTVDTLPRICTGQSPSSGPIFCDTLADATVAVNQYVLQELGADPAVAVDLEGTLAGIRPHVALLQAGTDRSQFVFDTHLVPCMLSHIESGGCGLRELLEDSSVVKILHCCHGDSYALRVEHGIVMQNVFDTAVADSLLGRRHQGTSRGLGPVLIEWLGDAVVHLTYKGKLEHVPFMFNVRPLTLENFVYSAEDVAYCVALWAVMLAALRAADCVELAHTLSMDRCQPYTAVPISDPRIAFVIVDAEWVLCLRAKSTGALELPVSLQTFELTLMDAHIVKLKASLCSEWTALMGAPPSAGAFATAVASHMRKPCRLGRHFIAVCTHPSLISIYHALKRVFADSPLSPSHRLTLCRRDCPSSLFSQEHRSLIQQIRVWTTLASMMPSASACKRRRRKRLTKVQARTILQERARLFLGRLRAAGVVVPVKASAQANAASGRKEAPTASMGALVVYDEEHCFVVTGPNSNSSWSFPPQSSGVGTSLLDAAVQAFDRYAGPAVRKGSNALPLAGEVGPTDSSRSWQLLPVLARAVQDGIDRGSALGKYGPNVAFFSCYVPNLGSHVASFIASRQDSTGFRLTSTEQRKHPFGGIVPHAAAFEHLASPDLAALKAALASGTNCTRSASCVHAMPRNVVDCVKRQEGDEASAIAFAAAERSRPRSYTCKGLSSMPCSPANCPGCMQAAQSNKACCGVIESLCSGHGSPEARYSVAPTVHCHSCGHIGPMQQDGSCLQCLLPCNPVESPSAAFVARTALHFNKITQDYNEVQHAAQCFHGKVLTISDLLGYPDHHLDSLAAQVQDDFAKTYGGACHRGPHSEPQELCVSAVLSTTGSADKPVTLRLVPRDVTATCQESDFACHRGQPVMSEPRLVLGEDPLDIQDLPLPQVAQPDPDDSSSAGADDKFRMPPLSVIADAQKQHPAIEPYITYHLSGTTPADMPVQELRAFKQEVALTYLDTDGVLRRTIRAVGSKGPVVLPPQYRTHAFRECHDRQGHFGVGKTWKLLRRLYWWPRARDDTRMYIRLCQVCRRIKVPRHHAGTGEIVNNGSSPWSYVTVDAYDVGWESGGYSKVLAFVDQFTRGVLCVPLPVDYTSEHVADAFVYVLMRFKGKPLAIRSDRGSVLISELIKQLYDKHNVVQEAGTAYHHPTAGVCERFFGVLKHLLLTHRLASKDDQWHRYLPLLEMAYNDTVNETTGFSPFFLDHLRHPDLALDVFTGRPHRGSDTLRPWLTDHLQMAVLVWEVCARQLNHQAIVVKECDDRKRETKISYVPGQRVILVEGRFVDGNLPKAEDPTDGPFTILKVLPKGNYVIGDLRSRRIHQIINEDRLMPWPTRRLDEEDALGQRYTVQRIVDRKPFTDVDGNASYKYRVRWAGWHKRNDSWHAMDTLHQVAPLVAAFNRVKPFEDGYSPTQLTPALETPVTPPVAEEAKRRRHFRALDGGFVQAPVEAPSLDVQYPVGAQVEMLYENSDGSYQWYAGTITRSVLSVDPKGAPDLSYSIRFPNEERTRSYKLNRNQLRLVATPTAATSKAVATAQCATATVRLSRDEDERIKVEYSAHDTVGDVQARLRLTYPEARLVLGSQLKPLDASQLMVDVTKLDGLWLRAPASGGARNSAGSSAASSSSSVSTMQLIGDLVKALRTTRSCDTLDDSIDDLAARFSDEPPADSRKALKAVLWQHGDPALTDADACRDAGAELSLFKSWKEDVMMYLRTGRGKPQQTASCSFTPLVSLLRVCAATPIEPATRDQFMGGCDIPFLAVQRRMLIGSHEPVPKPATWTVVNELSRGVLQGTSFKDYDIRVLAVRRGLDATQVDVLLRNVKTYVKALLTYVQQVYPQTRGKQPVRASAAAPSNPCMSRDGDEGSSAGPSTSSTSQLEALFSTTGDKQTLDARARALAEAVGYTRPEGASLKAVQAVVHRPAFPSNKKAWEHFGVSERSFKTYKQKLTQLRSGHTPSASTDTGAPGKKAKKAHSSCDASDSVGSSSFSVLTTAVSKVAKEEAFNAALGGVAACITSKDSKQQQRLRELAAHFGVFNVKEPTFRAMAAVLDQVAHPGRLPCDKDFWDAHQASRADFEVWKLRLLTCVETVFVDGITFKCREFVSAPPSPPPSPAGIYGIQRRRPLLPQRLLEIYGLPIDLFDLLLTFIDVTNVKQETAEQERLQRCLADAAEAAEKLHEVARVSGDPHYADLGTRQAALLERLTMEYAREYDIASTAAAQALLDASRTYVGACLYFGCERWIYLDPPKPTRNRAAYLHSVLVSYEQYGQKWPGVSIDEAADSELERAVSRGHRSDPRHTYVLRLLFALLLRAWREGRSQPLPQPPLSSQPPSALPSPPSSPYPSPPPSPPSDFKLLDASLTLRVGSCDHGPGYYFDCLPTAVRSASVIHSFEAIAGTAGRDLAESLVAPAALMQGVNDCICYTPLFTQLHPWDTPTVHNPGLARRRPQSSIPTDTFDHLIVLLDAMLHRSRRRLPGSLAAANSSWLIEVQFNTMDSWSTRDYHKDRFGDIIITLTLTGRCEVCIQKRIRALQEPQQFYVIFGDAVHGRLHGAQTNSDESRYSITYRLEQPPPPSAPPSPPSSGAPVDVSEPLCSGCLRAAYLTSEDEQCHVRFGMGSKPRHVHCHACNAVFRAEPDDICPCCGNDMSPPPQPPSTPPDDDDDQPAWLSVNDLSARFPDIAATLTARPPSTSSDNDNDQPTWLSAAAAALAARPPSAAPSSSSSLPEDDSPSQPRGLAHRDLVRPPLDFHWGAGCIGPITSLLEFVCSWFNDGSEDSAEQLRFLFQQQPRFTQGAPLRVGQRGVSAVVALNLWSPVTPWHAMRVMDHFMARFINDASPSLAWYICMAYHPRVMMRYFRYWAAQVQSVSSSALTARRACLLRSFTCWLLLSQAVTTLRGRHCARMRTLSRQFVFIHKLRCKARSFRRWVSIAFDRKMQACLRVYGRDQALKERMSDAFWWWFRLVYLAVLGSEWPAYTDPSMWHTPVPAVCELGCDPSLAYVLNLATTILAAFEMYPKERPISNQGMQLLPGSNAQLQRWRHAYIQQNPVMLRLHVGPLGLIATEMFLRAEVCLSLTPPSAHLVAYADHTVVIPAHSSRRVPIRVPSLLLTSSRERSLYNNYMVNVQHVSGCHAWYSRYLTCVSWHSCGLFLNETVEVPHQGLVSGDFINCRREDVVIYAQMPCARMQATVGVHIVWPEWVPDSVVRNVPMHLNEPIGRNIARHISQEFLWDNTVAAVMLEHYCIRGTAFQDWLKYVLRPPGGPFLWDLNAPLSDVLATQSPHAVRHEIQGWWIELHVWDRSQALEFEAHVSTVLRRSLASQSGFAALRRLPRQGEDGHTRIPTRQTSNTFYERASGMSRIVMRSSLTAYQTCNDTRVFPLMLRHDEGVIIEVQRPRLPQVQLPEELPINVREPDFLTPFSLLELADVASVDYDSDHLVTHPDSDSVSSTSADHGAQTVTPFSGRLTPEVEAEIVDDSSEDLSFDPVWVWISRNPYGGDRPSWSVQRFHRGASIDELFMYHQSLADIPTADIDDYVLRTTSRQRFRAGRFENWDLHTEFIWSGNVTIGDAMEISAHDETRNNWWQWTSTDMPSASFTLWRRSDAQSLYWHFGLIVGRPLRRASLSHSQVSALFALYTSNEPLTIVDNSAVYVVTEHPRVISSPDTSPTPRARRPLEFGTLAVRLSQIPVQAPSADESSVMNRHILSYGLPPGICRGCMNATQLNDRAIASIGPQDPNRPQLLYLHCHNCGYTGLINSSGVCHMCLYQPPSSLGRSPQPRTTTHPLAWQTMETAFHSRLGRQERGTPRRSQPPPPSPPPSPPSEATRVETQEDVYVTDALVAQEDDDTPHDQSGIWDIFKCRFAAWDYVYSRSSSSSMAMHALTHVLDIPGWWLITYDCPARYRLSNEHLARPSASSEVVREPTLWFGVQHDVNDGPPFVITSYCDLQSLVLRTHAYNPEGHFQRDSWLQYRTLYYLGFRDDLERPPLHIGLISTDHPTMSWRTFAEWAHMACPNRWPAADAWIWRRPRHNPLPWSHAHGVPTPWPVTRLGRRDWWWLKVRCHDDNPRAYQGHLWYRFKRLNSDGPFYDEALREASITSHIESRFDLAVMHALVPEGLGPRPVFAWHPPQENDDRALEFRSVLWHVLAADLTNDPSVDGEWGEYWPRSLIYHLLPSPSPSPAPPRALRSRTHIAPVLDLPVPVARQQLYQDDTTHQYRIAECTWFPSDGVDAGQWLLRWLTDDELQDATLPVIVTFFDAGGVWHAWTIACESLLLPGQYGLYAARDFIGAEVVGIMRDGFLKTYSAQSALRRDIEQLRAADGAHYLYLLPTRRQDTVALHDGRLSRPGGPRNANDARGSVLAANCRFMEDGCLVIRDFASISRRRPDVSRTQRSRSEILWDYGEDYWAVPLRPLLPVVGRRVFIQFRGDPGQPWYGGRVARLEMNGLHEVHFDDGWIQSFHLAHEQLNGQLRWNEEEPSNQHMNRG